MFGNLSVAAVAGALQMYVGDQRASRARQLEPQHPAEWSRSGAEAYFAAWAETHSIPTLLITSELAVLWVNAAGQDLLRTAQHFCVVSGRLACADKTQTAGLRAFVGGLDLDAEAWVCRGEDGGHLLVRGEPVQPRGEACGAALTLFAVDGKSRYVWADFGAVYGLTRAEAAIVERVIGGDRADAIAADLGVALDTVRTHTRRVYNKLGINSREQLFSLIAPFRVG